MAFIAGVAVCYDQYYLLIPPLVWVTGILVSQAIWDRCVILECISRLKKYRAAILVKGQTLLTPVEKPDGYKVVEAVKPKTVGGITINTRKLTIAIPDETHIPEDIHHPIRQSERNSVCNRCLNQNHLAPEYRPGDRNATIPVGQS